MKKHYFLLISAVVLFASAPSQNLILNGSFENNTATVNTMALTTTWATTVANSFEVDGGQMDLITSNNCGTASDGNWFVTCSNVGGGWPYMAFSFKLSTTLIAGAQYTITFDKRYCGPNSSPIDIGVSNDSTVMGTAVHTFAAPLSTTWALETYVFQAPLAAKYVTVNVGVAGGTGTVGLDKFSLTAMATGVNEISAGEITVFPDASAGLFTVTLPAPANKMEIEIYTVTGERVWNSTVENTVSTIDMSKQAKGIYFYKISTSNGIVKQGKIAIR